MIILASSSPRRKEILEMAGIDFEVMNPGGEEIPDITLSPAKIASTIALEKARRVFSRWQSSESSESSGGNSEKNRTATAILAADTIVVTDYGILGKPVSAADARRMLEILSGRVHTVITGVAVIRTNSGKAEVFSESTAVEFYKLSAEEITRYLETGEYADKAGAYGIQGRGAVLVKRIDGDFFNVMGLPVGRVSRLF
ncbi:septum formation protein Maf [Clostridia bacterium]|nr:septum formation protein Maf [Clostridia bacterium]